MRDVLTLMLAGGKGQRLEPLTRERAKPSVPFGGIYRIIDFALSNCINSGLRRVLVLTQYKAASLDRHINIAWRFLCRELNEFIVRGADPVSATADTAAVPVVDVLVDPTPTRRHPVFASISAFAGTALGKIFIGASVAAAGVGGALAWVGRAGLRSLRSEVSSRFRRTKSTRWARADSSSCCWLE